MIPFIYKPIDMLYPVISTITFLIYAQSINTLKKGLRERERESESRMETTKVQKNPTIWLRLSMRFSGITPIKYIAHPMIGYKKMEVLLINLKLRPRVSNV